MVSDQTKRRLIGDYWNEYNTLPITLQVIVDQLCVEYTEMVDAYEKEQEYETASKTRRFYKLRAATLMFGLLKEWEIYNRELENYLSNENNS